MSSDKSSMVESKPPGAAEANGVFGSDEIVSNPTSTHGFGDIEIQNFIGDQLRSMYNSVLNEPISESLLALLKDLDQKKSNKS